MVKWCFPPPQRPPPHPLPSRDPTACRGQRAEGRGIETEGRRETGLGRTGHLGHLGTPGTTATPPPPTEHFFGQKKSFPAFPKFPPLVSQPAARAASALCAFNKATSSILPTPRPLPPRHIPTSIFFPLIPILPFCSFPADSCGHLDDNDSSRALLHSVLDI